MAAYPAKLADRILDYHFQLRPDWELPEGVELLFPYDRPETRAAMTAFYQKYYDDRDGRVFLFGINPGRFGAGVTGIPFTDPVRLQADCGIPNPFRERAELSSDFVYRVVRALGGPRCGPSGSRAPPHFEAPQIPTATRSQSIGRHKRGPG